MEGVEEEEGERGKGRGDSGRGVKGEGKFRWRRKEGAEGRG